MVRDAAGRPRQYCPELPCPRLPCAALRGLALRQLCGQNQWGAVSGWGGTPLRHPQGRGDLARASRAQRAKQRACRQDGHRRTLPTRVRLLHLLNEREASLLHRSFASVPLPPRRKVGALLFHPAPHPHRKVRCQGQFACMQGACRCGDGGATPLCCSRGGARRGAAPLLPTMKCIAHARAGAPEPCRA